MPAVSRRLSSLALLVLLAALRLTAQVDQPQTDRELFSAGLYAGYGMSFISSDFALDGNGQLTPFTECGRFESGAGHDFIVGGIVEMPVKDRLRLSLRSEYIAHSGTLRFRCVDPATTRMPDGTLATALTDHVAEITGSALSLRLDAAFRPFTFPLQFLAGPMVTLPLALRYAVHEEIVSPASAEFVSGGQIRPYGDATFESTSLAVSVVGGTRYRAQVGERLTLLPEMTYRLALTNEAPDAALRFNALVASLGVVYRFDRAEEQQPELSPPPTPEQPPALSVSLNLHPATDADDDTLRVRTNRTIITEVHPLLNFVFFDSGSAALPSRYRTRSAAEIVDFTEQGIRSSDNLRIYYNLLDIIGARLRRSPSATIILTGTQPDALPGRDGTAELARQRANTVATYLRETWGIASERISIEARQMPATPSNPERREGSEENRRVEITSNDYRITDPVLLSDTIRRSEAPPLVIEPTVRAEAGIERWELQVRGGGASNGLWSGSEPPPAAIRWSADSLLTTSGRKEQMLVVDFVAVDGAGQTRNASARIPVRPVTLADSISYGAGFYSLILFDFGRSQLSPAHIRTIDLVNARTTASARAKVYGFTDRLGEEALNMQLSAERAKAVAKYLKATVVEVTGRGVNTELYDNSLPEGRFYSRSVTIETE